MIMEETLIKQETVKNPTNKILCFVCENPVNDEYFYEIRLCNNSAAYHYYTVSKTLRRKHIVFHKRCFAEIAGEEFTFSDE